VHTRGAAIQIASVDMLDITGAGFSFLAQDQLPMTLEPGEQLVVPFHYNATALGYHRSRITFVSSAADAQLASEARVRVVEPLASIRPLQLDFGPVDAGSLAQSTVTVSNDGLADLVIEGATPPAGITVDTSFPIDLPAGAEAEIALSYQSADASTVSGTLQVALSSGDLPAVTVMANDCLHGLPTAWDGDHDGYKSCRDCDDSDPTVHPGQTEGVNDVDQDCDGKVDDTTVAYDDDGDGVSEEAGDCNDRVGTTYPGASELADGVDNDCDGKVDEGTVRGDDDSDGYTENGGDCNDADRNVHPGAPDAAGGVDSDCNPSTP